MTIEWNGYTCKTVFDKYENGRTAIRLVDDKDGSPIATATINLPGEWVAENQVLIKDYSENSGMAKALLDAGVVANEVGRLAIGPFGAEVAVMEIAESMEDGE